MRIQHETLSKNTGGGTTRGMEMTALFSRSDTANTAKQKRPAARSCGALGEAFTRFAGASREKCFG
ncbi:hypothetical protein EV701_11172 [Chthoniobacter flavus]|nr:hypothetical protein EV701_11172 [Chthoniobacter flavus]